MMALMIVLIMPFFANASHEVGEKFVANGRNFVYIDRFISRGKILYPIFYQVREDIYAYALPYVVVELKNIYYDVEIAKRLGVRYTTYADLGITLFEVDNPTQVTEIIRELEKEPMAEYVELALVEGFYEIDVPGIWNDKNIQWFDKW